jgi:hypothetical protein
MSLNTYVQFFRNFGCVLKALLPKDSYVIKQTMALPWAAYLTILFPNIFISRSPDPSYLQYFIAITQFYVVFVYPYYALIKLMQGYRQLIKLRHQQTAINRISLTKPSTEVIILSSAVSQAIDKVWMESIIGGFVEIINALQFVYLGLGSLQIQLPRHPAAIIEAVCITEVALIFFLYLMWQSWQQHVQIAASSRRLLANIESKQEDIKAKNEKPLTLVDILSLAHDAGFARNISEIIPALGIDYSTRWILSEEDIVLEDEIQRLNIALKDVLSPIDIPLKASKLLGITDAKLKVHSKLTAHATTHEESIPMEIIYFLLNLLAFYGYLLGILTFYFPRDEIWLWVMKFGQSHGVASTVGEFLGDLAWTIEPILVIVTPHLSQISAASAEPTSPRAKTPKKAKEE